MSPWRCEISPLGGLRVFHSFYVMSSILKCGVVVKGFTDPNTKSANKERMAKFDSHTSILQNSKLLSTISGSINEKFMQLLAHQWAKRFLVNTNMYIIFSYLLKENYNYLCPNLYLIQV